VGEPVRGAVRDRNRLDEAAPEQLDDRGCLQEGFGLGR
jgi:hypothetical protein